MAGVHLHCPSTKLDHCTVNEVLEVPVRTYASDVTLGRVRVADVFSEAAHSFRVAGGTGADVRRGKRLGKVCSATLGFFRGPASGGDCDVLWRRGGWEHGWPRIFDRHGHVERGMVESCLKDVQSTQCICGRCFPTSTYPSIWVSKTFPIHLPKVCVHEVKGKYPDAGVRRCWSKNDKKE